MKNSMLNLNTKPSQIGIQCSGTRSCTQRYEIGHFCPCMFSVVQRRVFGGDGTRSERFPRNWRLSGSPSALYCALRALSVANPY